MLAGVVSGTIRKTFLGVGEGRGRGWGGVGGIGIDQ